ncbi:MAG: hypothetical protein HKN25_10965 [Pyrinomonadaceae bacterium]|nr:hypothetical protein [Pyrinomonadaceae bacterium]
MILCVSQDIFDEYSRFQTPMHVIPHAISSEAFEIESDHELEFDRENYGVFVGVIDARLDFDLIEEAAKRFSDEEFVFVGPLRLPESASAKRLFVENRYENVTAIGSRPFKELKYYINKSKFCLSFMDKEYPGNKVGHHKTQVYLSQGKPVFGPKFSDYKDLGDIMYMDDCPDGILEKLARFLEVGEEDSLSRRRIESAKAHSYENTLQKINDILQRQAADLG